MISQGGYRCRPSCMIQYTRLNEAAEHSIRTAENRKDSLLKRKKIQFFAFMFFLLSLCIGAALQGEESAMPVINLDPLNLSGNSPNFAAAFREKQGAVKITSPDAVITDSAGTGLTAITVRLVQPMYDDVLEADTGGTDMIATYQDGVLHITSRNIGGWDSAENYQAVLRTVVFKNDSPNPDETPRQIEVLVQRENQSGDPVFCNLTVTAVNDAPVNTIPGSQFTPRDIPLIFSPGNGNRISVSDLDAGEGEMAADVHADQGSLSVNSTSGAVIEGNDSGHLSLKGTMDQINREFNGLRYIPPSGKNGNFTLTLVSDDQGHTGNPGHLLDSDTVLITAGVPVAPEPPVADAGADQTVDGSATVTLDGSASYVPDGEIAAYVWTQIGGGTGVVISNADTVFPTFTSPAEEQENTLIFQLKVTVSNDLWAIDTVNVTVRGNPQPQPDGNAGDSGGCFLRSLIKNIADSGLNP